MLVFLFIKTERCVENFWSSVIVYHATPPFDCITVIGMLSPCTSVCNPAAQLCCQCWWYIHIAKAESGATQSSKPTCTTFILPWLYRWRISCPLHLSQSCCGSGSNVLAAVDSCSLVNRSNCGVQRNIETPIWVGKLTGQADKIRLAICAKLSTDVWPRPFQVSLAPQHHSNSN